MRKWRPWRATKLELLLFINGRRIIHIFDLVEEFGYTYRSAEYRLALLKKQNLAVSDGKGSWVLTSEGTRRLRWLTKNRLEKKSERKSPMR